MKTIIPLRRPSLRLKDYDYRQTGAYFITICAKDRQSLFGKIIDGAMLLNNSGRIVHKEWLNLAKLRANIELDEFVIMPNHFHAILWILGERWARQAVPLQLSNSASRFLVLYRALSEGINLAF